MDYEYEIKRLRRLNMKMYFTMSSIISILNKRETEELYKLTMKSIDKDMIFITEGYEDSNNCGCGKIPNKQCEEIEEYLKEIKMVD